MATAVNGTIASMNTVKTWIQELWELRTKLKNAENTLAILTLQYQTSVTALSSWSDFWGISGNTTIQNFEQGLWGKAISDLIQKKLKFISDRHDEIKDLLGLPLRHKLKSIDSLKVIMKTEPDVRRRLEAIKKEMEEVKEVSERAFNKRHHQNMTSETSQCAMDKAKTNIFLDAIFNSRKPSTEFYQSCFRDCDRFESNNVHLGMDVYPEDLDIGPSFYQLQYILQFPGTRKYTIEGPLDGVNGAFEAFEPSMYEACDKTHSHSTRKLFRVGAFWFNVTNGDQNSRADRLRPLKDILYDLNSKVLATGFPLSERIHFAFELAQLGFFLCGTSWMADLQLKNIQSIRDGQDRHFFLDIHVSRSALSNHKDKQIYHFAQHAFYIGLLLLQIGTGKTLVNYDHDYGNLTFHLVSSSGEKLDASIDSIPALVQYPIGQQYKEVMKRCLQDPTNWIRELKGGAHDRDNVYSKVLSEYYLKIYTP